MICPDCKGSGTYTGLTVVEPCRTCNGTGSVRDGGEERGKWFGEPLILRRGASPDDVPVVRPLSPIERMRSGSASKISATWYSES
jgi:RecJ-like exonuclease